MATEFVGPNILEVEAGTNGFQGGDAGHGSRTFFAIRNKRSTVMTSHICDDNQLVRMSNCEEVAIVLSGDSELEAFLSALKFAVKTLEEQISERKEKR